MISYIGASASILGVLVALVGFWITIVNVKRSRRAARRAESAANQALEGVRRVDTVQNLSKAISIVEEMQRLNRTKEWKVLLDRHSTFRNILIEVRGSTPNLNDEHKKDILAGINHSQAMSHKIEVALDKEESPGGTPK